MSYDENPISHFSFWAILGSLLTVAATLLTFLLAKIRAPAKVKLVNAEITNANTVAHFVHFNLPVIDIIFTNERKKIAVVTAAEVEVRNVWDLVLQFPVMQGLPVSGKYTLQLDPGKAAPYKVEVPISHVLKSDEGDRIQITIGLNPLKPFERFYQLSIRLIYDRDKKTKPFDFVLVLPDMSGSNGKPEYFLADFDRKFAEHQKKTWASQKIKEIADLVFNRTGAEEIHNHNKLSIVSASLVRGYRNDRATELIGLLEKGAL